MAAGSAVISDNSKDLNRLTNGAGTLAASLGDVRAQINRIAPSMQRLIDAFSSMRSQFGGDKLVRDVETAAKLVQSINALGNAMGVNFSTVKDMFAWVGPVLAALNGNAICDANPSCSDTRIQFQKLVAARDDGRLDQINTLAGQLQGFGDRQTLNATVKQLNDALSNFSSAVRSMGLDRPGGLQAGLTQVRQDANRLADGSQQVAGGVDQLVGQVKLMGAGLDEAAAFLLAMRNDAADPSMAGFNLPAQILQLDEFKAAAKIFISPDGHSARYLVQTTLNPFSAEAMDQVKEISDTARSAQPNTQLADAKISMGGFPAALRDTRDYYEHDIRFIIVVTLVVVLLILMALLRAIVAPLYLVGSVVISYFAALGISVLTFQYLLGQQLHWSVPPLAFVVLVAVGADYNLLFVSRMRDESPHGMRYGVIRTLTSTGGVITAAGLIFAASMCGLLFSSITTVVQGGFVIGVGVLLDTFLVRTITVPAMATLVGRANWWPSRLSMQGTRGAIEPPSRAPARAGRVMSRVTVSTDAKPAVGVGMRRLLAVVTALVTVGATGCFGSGIAAADDIATPAGRQTTGHRRRTAATGTPGRGYALGGAHVLGIPYDEYIKRTGADWFPGLDRQIVDYPAGQVQGHVLERLFPGISRLQDGFPGLGIDGPSIGESVDEGEGNLEAAIRDGGPGTAIGLSEGAMVLDAVQAKLANDPTAPPPNTLSFATYGDPLAKHAFGESFLTQMFPVGSVVPALDFRMPAPVESQYDTYQFVSAYDSIADWPDRPDNWMSLAQRGRWSRDRSHRGGVHQSE